MDRQEFLDRLREGLSGLPQEDVEERLLFYSEMIADRMEEGLSEVEAVSAAGDADEIVRQIVADTPLAKIAKARIKPKRRLRAWEIVLLALGAPIWLSIGIAFLAVVIAIYVSLWAILIALWAVFAALTACGLVGALTGVYFPMIGSVSTGFAALAAGMICAGLAIFMFLGCWAATKFWLRISKKIALGLKRSLIQKEGAQ